MALAEKGIAAWSDAQPLFFLERSALCVLVPHMPRGGKCLAARLAHHLK